MASPRPSSYQGPSGRKLAAGRAIYANGLLDLIAVAPAWSWIKANTNRFQDAWAHPDVRTLFGDGPNNPSAVIRAWSSFAWDTRRHQMILWGGGHGNSSGNEAYIWSATSQRWSLAYHNSDVVQIPSSNKFRPIDYNASPISSHTYGNNAYLPVLDKFLVFGGASHGDGDRMWVWNGNTNLRSAGSFTLDLALIGQGFVGSTTGANPKRGTYAGVSIPGAYAWRIHDWHDPARVGGSFDAQSQEHIDSGSVVINEGGKDAVYYTARTGTSRAVFRVVFNDSDPANDVQTRVSNHDAGIGSGQGPITFDTGRGIIIKLRRGDLPVIFQFVDTKNTWGRGNNWNDVSMVSGADSAEFLLTLTLDTGISFDPINHCFLLWTIGRQVWQLYPPEGNPTPTTGWSVVKPPMSISGQAPRATRNTADANENDTGTIGKWRWADDMLCFVALQNNYDGNVWLLKPAGWADPRT